MAPEAGTAQRGASNSSPQPIDLLGVLGALSFHLPQGDCTLAWSQYTPIECQPLEYVRKDMRWFLKFPKLVAQVHINTKKVGILKQEIALF